MSIRQTVFLGVTALIMPASGFAQADAGDAARNWTAIAQCGSIAQDDRRLGCMDDVLRRAGVGRVSAAEQAPRPQARVDERSVPSSTIPAARPSEPEDRQAGALTTTITSVQTIGYERLLVTTADGSTWEQTQAQSFLTPAKAGDAFSVEPAAMGSFRCRFNQSSRYRCKQVD